MRKENNNKRPNSSRARGRQRSHNDRLKIYHVISAREDDVRRQLPTFLEEFGYPVELIAERPGSERQYLDDSLEGAEGYLFPNDLIDLDLLSVEWKSFSINKGLEGTPLLVKVKVARGKSSVSRLNVGRT